LFHIGKLGYIFEFGLAKNLRKLNLAEKLIMEIIEIGKKLKMEYVVTEASCIGGKLAYKQCNFS